MTEICAGCGHELALHGIQRDDIQGTESDLMHCLDPDCPEYMRTRSYHVRPMSPEILAARKERLRRSIAEHSATALFK